jgi:biopolymer transport protein ExbD
MTPRALSGAAFLVVYGLMAACRTETSSVNLQDDFSMQLIINVDSQGSMSVVPQDTGERLDEDEARTYVENVLQNDPDVQVFVQAEPQAPTAAIVRIFAWLHESGASTGTPEIAEGDSSL